VEENNYSIVLVRGRDLSPILGRAAQTVVWAHQDKVENPLGEKETPGNKLRGNDGAGGHTERRPIGAGWI